MRGVWLGVSERRDDSGEGSRTSPDLFVGFMSSAGVSVEESRSERRVVRGGGGHGDVLGMGGLRALIGTGGEGRVD